MERFGNRVRALTRHRASRPVGIVMRSGLLRCIIMGRMLAAVGSICGIAAGRLLCAICTEWSLPVWVDKLVDGVWNLPV